MDTYGDLIKKYQPNLWVKLRDPREKLSNTILFLRASRKLSLVEMASRLKMSEWRYLKFEYGDLDIPIREYEHLIKRIKSMSR